MCPWSFVGKRRMGMQVVVFSCKLVSGKQRLQFQFLPNIFPALSVAQWGVVKRVNYSKHRHTYITMFSNPALPLAQWGSIVKRVSKPIRLKSFYLVAQIQPCTTSCSTVGRSEKSQLWEQQTEAYNKCLVFIQPYLYSAQNGWFYCFNLLFQPLHLCTKISCASEPFVYFANSRTQLLINFQKYLHVHFQ